MSKEAAQRAMREANYARRNARPGTPARRPAPAAPGAPPSTPPPSMPAAAAEPESTAPAEAGLCGHRSMNGRTCTREAGHAAKSHRYS